MSEGDINLATLWVPVLPETSKIGEAMRKAGEHGRREFEQGFGSGSSGFDSMFNTMSAKTIAFGTAIGTTLGNLASGAIQMFGHALESALTSAIDLAKEAADEFVKMGEQFEGINRQLELFTTNADALKDVATGILSNMDSDAKYLANDLALVNDRLGMTKDQMAEFTHYVEVLRDRLGSLDLDGLTQALGAFGIAGDQDTEMLAELLQAQQRYGTNMNTIIGQLSTESQAFLDMGLTMSQAIDLLGQLDAKNKGAADAILKLSSVAQKAASAHHEGIQQYITDETRIIKQYHDMGRDDLAQQEAFLAYGSRNWQQAIAFGEAYVKTMNKSPAELKANADALAEMERKTRTLTNAWHDFQNKIISTLGPVSAQILEKLGGALTTVGDWFTTHHDQIIMKIKGWGDAFIDALPKIQHFVGEAIRITGTFIDFFVNGLGYIVQALGVITGNDALYNLGNKLTHFDISALSDKIADAVESPNIDTAKIKQWWDDAMNKAMGKGPDVDAHVHPVGPDGKPLGVPQDMFPGSRDGIHIKIIPEVDTSHIPGWVKFMFGGILDAFEPESHRADPSKTPPPLPGPGAHAETPGGTSGPSNENQLFPPHPDYPQAGPPNVLPGPGHQGLPLPAHTSSYTSGGSAGGGYGGGGGAGDRTSGGSGSPGSGGTHDGVLVRSTDATGGTPAQNMELARAMFPWPESEWPNFVKLENSEAGFNPTAQNPTSTAYGMGQFLDTTWAPYGPKTSDPKLQLEYMYRYIQQRYGTPSAAWAFHQSANWYNKGGPSGEDNVPAWLTPGEFVVNKDATSRWLPLLQMLNARRFGGGGQVGGVLQVIWDNAETGSQVGEADGQLVGPGTSQPGYYRNDWKDHTGHVHTSFASGPDGEPYGLPAGTDIRPGAGGFPSWVYALGGQYGLDASTYAGHQEGSGKNRGIDWWPHGRQDMGGGSYSPAERSKLQAFAEAMAMAGSGGQGQAGGGVRFASGHSGGSGGSGGLSVAGWPSPGGSGGSGGSGSNPYQDHQRQHRIDSAQDTLDEAKAALAPAQEKEDAAKAKLDEAKAAAADPGLDPKSDLYKQRQKELQTAEREYQAAVRQNTQAKHHLSESEDSLALANEAATQPEKGQGKKTELPDVFSSMLDLFGFGNVFGGKSPMDWEITKFLKNALTYGFAMTEFWAKGKNSHLPGGGGGGPDMGDDAGIKTADTGGGPTLPNIPKVNTRPTVPQGQQNQGALVSYHHDQSVNIHGNEYADATKFVKPMQEAQNSRFHTMAGGLPAVTSV